MLELVEAIDKGRLVADGKLLHSDGSCVVTKAAIEHVWHLPGKCIMFPVFRKNESMMIVSQELQSDSASQKLRFEGVCLSKLEACFLNLLLARI